MEKELNGQREEVKKKIVSLLLLAATVYLVSDMLNLLLLTFIFSFLLYSLTSWIVKVASRWIDLSEKLVILAVYGGLLATIWIAGYLYVPIIANQMIGIVNVVMNFNLAEYKDVLHPKVLQVIQEVNFESQFKEAAGSIFEASKNVGTFLISLILSFILSFFILWEKKEIRAFLKPYEEGKISFIYRYYSYFAKNFANTFGKMLQTQILISLMNSVLSVICLYFMGFEQVWGLAVMIFVLGLVPVAGVIISLIPLSIIAFKLGGIIKIIHVLIMIIVLHAFESYVLNPKLVSARMKLPVFFSFAVLIIAEHILGVWGLLVGIPLFMFILDLLKEPSIKKDDKDKPERKEAS
ncbi:AI-2E family transporter [Brevibacillus sp. NPDC058079]|uniref:AI-2E family transporter n=1 Tax=Brevibacillus sp. NPDC058079 TaxID=3346330 RepID=UPI0036E61A8A